MAMYCPICDAEDGEVFVAKEQMFGLPGSFRYRECTGCGCLYLMDEPADLPAYYPDDYYSFQRHKISLARKTRAKLYLSRFSSLVDWRPRSDFDALKAAQFDKNKSLLDVGSGGAAWMVHDLRELGYKAVGVDPYIKADVHDRFGVSVMKQTLDAVAGVYDIVVFRHSLEHMSAPRDVMRKVRSLLSPGGVCIVCVPVVGWAWKHYRVNWIQLDPPRHLCIYTPKAMALLAEGAGLDCFKTVYDSTDYQFWASDEQVKGRLLTGSKPPRGRIRGDLRRKARALNAQGLGDSAQFFLAVRSP